MKGSSAENQVADTQKSSWGRIIGVILGFSFGGPWGALFGYIIGNAYDDQKANSGEPSSSNLWKDYEAFSARREQATFTMGVIVLSAKMARSDGRVTREEINAFKRVFNVKPHLEDAVGRLFNRARLSAEGFEPYAMSLANVFRNNPSVLEQILSGLFIIGASDSTGLGPAEIVFLKKVSSLFGFANEDFSRIAARSGVTLPQSEVPHPPLPEPYVLLGIKETATATEIKAAYHALIREHHPDKLIAQGMPPEFVATATEKMKRINAAYDTICRMKGIK